MVTKNSRVGRQIMEAGLIIWDEVPMQHKYCFEAVHRLLCDLRTVTDEVLFGGIPVLLGGDFAQILPVIPNGSRADVVKACLQRSFIWSRLRRLHLRVNMRVRGGLLDEDFITWIGRLPYDPQLYGMIPLPPYITQFKALNDLITSIYPEHVLRSVNQAHDVFTDRAILTVHNTTVLELNALILSRFQGTLQTMLSIDTADVNESGGNVHQVPIEELQNATTMKLPLSLLQLKVGVPVMLLRNIVPQEGLCNGSRMVIISIKQHCLEVCLLGEQFYGQLRTIPRIKLQTNDGDLPYILTRKQFPVRLCFAMTINKSQGQSFKLVGVDLRAAMFSHGQFYVAMSRTSSVAGLHVLLPEGDDNTTKNEVFPEVLSDIN